LAASVVLLVCGAMSRPRTLDEIRGTIERSGVDHTCGNAVATLRVP
jgi:hypothetical protein